MTEEFLLQVRNVGLSDERGFALRNISFSQQQGQHVVIAGETGSGKSTLLKIIAGLAQPQTGSVLFEGEPVKGPRETLVPGHPAIAYLPQYFDLPKFLRVEQVLEYASKITPREADRIFRLCKIRQLLNRKTDELSGGERQRIALCRLLIGKPVLLLLDEPYTNLDMIVKGTLKEVIQSISHQLGITTLLVSHDPEETLPWADHILILKGGKLVQQGSPEEIYFEPRNEYVAGLFGRYSVISQRLHRAMGGAGSGKAIIRPEQLVIRKGRSKSGVPGTVIVQKFAGHGYEITVDLKGTAVSCVSADSTLGAGTTVTLRLRM
ncbi:MAG: ABC transporter ATP-binding protein [Cyclobacteriaceae bacterium]|jgi:ABC-type Fe3+/spermidine/putrescine transport system ATPase subunit